MAYYKLIAFAFIALVVLPNTFTMADDHLDDGPFDDDHDDVPGVPDHDDDHDDVPGVPDDDHDDDGPPRTNPPVIPTPTTPMAPPSIPTQPPATPTTPMAPPSTPTQPPATPTTPPANPTQPPATGNLCTQVDCGQGRCVLNASAPFGYKCACDRGWRRLPRGYDDDDFNDRDDDINDRDDDLHDDDDDDDKGYLACVIPDCNMNYTCQGSPAPPMPPKPVPVNSSVFDPCYWTNCGEGTCIKSADSEYKHICQCNQGFNNLMNISYFPCYSNCVIGDDCANLGVRNSAPGSNTKGLADGINTDNGSQAMSPRNFYWVGTVVAMALALWQ